MLKKLLKFLERAFIKNDWDYDREGQRVYKRVILWREVVVALACLWLLCAGVYITGWVLAHYSLKCILEIGALVITVLSAAVVFAAVTGDI